MRRASANKSDGQVLTVLVTSLSLMWSKRCLMLSALGRCSTHLSALTAPIPRHQQPERSENCRTEGKTDAATTGTARVQMHFPMPNPREENSREGLGGYKD